MVQKECKKYTLYALSPHALFVLSSMRLSVQTIHLHGVKGSGQ